MAETVILIYKSRVFVLTGTHPSLESDNNIYMLGFLCKLVSTKIIGLTCHNWEELRLEITGAVSGACNPTWDINEDGKAATAEDHKLRPYVELFLSGGYKNFKNEAKEPIAH